VLASGFIAFALKERVNRDRPFVTYPDIEQATTATGSSFQENKKVTEF
jgi:hypothetical protein